MDHTPKATQLSSLQKLFEVFMKVFNFFKSWFLRVFLGLMKYVSNCCLLSSSYCNSFLPLIVVARIFQMTGWRSCKYSRSPQGIYHNQGRVQKKNVKREKMSLRYDTPSSGHKFATRQGTHYTFADGSCFSNGKPNARAGYVLFVNVCCCRSLSI